MVPALVSFESLVSITSYDQYVTDWSKDPLFGGDAWQVERAYCGTWRVEHVPRFDMKSTFQRSRFR